MGYNIWLSFDLKFLLLNVSPHGHGAFSPGICVDLAATNCQAFDHHLGSRIIRPEAS